MLDPVELLRKHRVPITAQRLAVMRAVAKRPHATADAIAEDVRDDIGTISRQAVYDTLGLLAGKGLVRRIQTAGSAALYESRVDDNHHHLICRACGKTIDVDCDAGEIPSLALGAATGFQVEGVEVVYWGICPDCLVKT